MKEKVHGGADSVPEGQQHDKQLSDSDNFYYFIDFLTKNVISEATIVT